MSDGRSVPIHLNPSTHLRFSQLRLLSLQLRHGEPGNGHVRTTPSLSRLLPKHRHPVPNHREADDEHHSDDGECDRDTTDISLRTALSAESQTCAPNRPGIYVWRGSTYVGCRRCRAPLGSRHQLELASLNAPVIAHGLTGRLNDHLVYLFRLGARVFVLCLVSFATHVHGDVTSYFRFGSRLHGLNLHGPMFVSSCSELYTRA